MPPTAARKVGADIKAFPRISFQLTVKGASEMKYKIVEKKAFQVYGIEEIFDTRDGEHLKDIPDFWTEKLKNGEYEKLLKSLEKSRDGNGNLSLGFEIIVAHAFKKDSSLPAGEKVMQFYGRNYPEN